MAEKKYTWHKIAESKEELCASGNTLMEINVGNKKICVGIYKELMFACANKCPHAGGRMADGWVDAMGNIVCPLHRYRFNLSNGRNVSGEGYHLKTYPIDTREDGIYVGLEENRWF
jgi:3-phenylpropionate/trans-cinnamate dioxygenase ferredoxin subunit